MLFNNFSTLGIAFVFVSSEKRGSPRDWMEDESVETVCVSSFALVIIQSGDLCTTRFHFFYFSNVRFLLHWIFRLILYWQIFFFLHFAHDNTTYSNTVFSLSSQEDHKIFTTFDMNKKGFLFSKRNWKFKLFYSFFRSPSIPQLNKRAGKSFHFLSSTLQSLSWRKVIFYYANWRWKVNWFTCVSTPLRFFWHTAGRKLAPTLDPNR